MAYENQIIQLLAQLTKETVKGRLKWNAKSPPESFEAGTNDLIPLYFESVHKGQKIGLALRRRQNYFGEFDRFFWDENAVLIFVDGFNRVLWEHEEQSSALWNLFKVVREQSADIGGIMKHLISHEIQS